MLKKIKQQVFDEYARNFVHRVQDLRAEFKAPKLPVVVGGVGVGGDRNISPDMCGFAEAMKELVQAKQAVSMCRAIRHARVAP